MKKQEIFYRSPAEEEEMKKKKKDRTQDHLPLGVKPTTKIHCFGCCFITRKRF